jgi:AcrR family transcriptional regulator
MAAIRMSADDRREQIINVAAELFAQQGFKGTTTRQIAAEAGITEALVYRYFSTKKSLYSAIIAHKTSETTVWDFTNIKDAMITRDDRQVFIAAAVTILETTRKDPGLMRLLLYSALEDHQLSNLFFQSQITNLVKVLADYISTRISDGEFDETDPMLAARGFLGMINHQVLMREIFKHQAYLQHSIQELADSYAALFLDGVRLKSHKVVAGV